MKKERVVIWTPPGRISFPYFVAPDTGRQYSDNKYKTDLLIPKAIFKEKGKGIQDAVKKVGLEHFGKNFKLVGGKQRTPFKDTDTDDKVTNDAMKSCILIRAKSKRPPLFIGPRKGSDGKFLELTEKEIADIKGGDWAVLNLSVFAYDQQGGGVSFGLNAVQFWKADEGFGQGKSVIMQTAEELEAEIDDVSGLDVAEEEVEEESIV